MPKPQSLTKLSQTSAGKIYVSANFVDGVYFLEKQTERDPKKRRMALFDLDNTVLSYRHTLGTDQWFDLDFSEFIKNGLSPTQAKKQVLSTYLEVVRKIHTDDIYVVEENTPATIRRLQQMGVDTLALTSRGSYLLQETIDQLARFQIDFNQGTYGQTVKSLPQSIEGLYSQGLILTAGQHKGACLLTAIAEDRDLPDFIVMWDDKLSNLEKVRASIEEYNQRRLIDNPDFSPVQFIGIRYSRLDHIINNVNPRITELQKKYHERILSDEHALAILKAEKKKHRQHFVAIDYQPQDDKVVIAFNKYATYDILKNVFPTLPQFQIVGGVKEFNGKKKLAWHFQFTFNEFAPLFHHLSQHGLIEPAQFIVLDPLFNPPVAPLVPLYQYALTTTPALQAPVVSSQISTPRAQSPGL